MISRTKKKQQGYSLTEIILVLAIMFTAITLGMRSYKTYQTDANILEVQQNVDKIFNAMALYYHKNCNGSISGSGFNAGTLNPSNGYPTRYAINLTTDLVDNGFLAQAPSQNNPVISTNNPTGNAYIVQFNSGTNTTQEKQICVSAVNGVCTNTANVGTIYIWEAQVSVMLNTSSASEAQAYLQMLGGDCLSTFNPNKGIVRPCGFGGNPSSPGYFVVWQRPPSVGMGGSLSSMWQINPITRDFYINQSTPSMSYLLGPNGSTTTYLCGG